MRVLLVEDDDMIGRSLSQALESNGWSVDWVKDGLLAQSALSDGDYACVLLDLGLPKRDGTEVLAKARAQGNTTPVLVLTARDGLDDRIAGLDLGADDYLLKPFAGEELLWRCQALSRRGELGRSPLLERGPLQIDRRSAEVRIEGQVLPPLPRQAYRLLLALAEAYPRTLSRSELQQALWADEPPESDALRSHLYTLRQALGPAQGLVKTVHSVGLRLDIPA